MSMGRNYHDADDAKAVEDQPAEGKAFSSLSEGAMRGVYPYITP